MDLHTYLCVKLDKQISDVFRRVSDVSDFSAQSSHLHTTL